MNQLRWTHRIISKELDQGYGLRSAGREVACLAFESLVLQGMRSWPETGGLLLGDRGMQGYKLLGFNHERP